MTYEEFEYKAIKKLLEGSDPNFEKLFDQFLDAEVLKREDTQTGFIVEFEVSEFLSIDDKVMRKISGVSVILANAEVLELELVISEGLITQLTATSITKIKYSDVVSKFSNFTFTNAGSAPIVKNIAEVEEPRDVIVQSSEILKRTEQLSAKNFRTEELLQQEEAKNLKLKELLEQGKAINSELSEKFEKFYTENIQLKELIEQERDKSPKLVEESGREYAKNIELKEALAQKQAVNLELVEKSGQVALEIDHTRELLEQENSQNAVLVAQTASLLSESIRTKELLEQEQSKSPGLVDKAEHFLAETKQLNELLAQKQATNSELIKRVEQLSLENDQAKEFLEKENSQNAQLVAQTANLLSENIRAKELLEKEQVKDPELAVKTNQLKKLLEQQKAKNAELVEKFEKLSFENAQTKDLLKKENIRQEQIIDGTATFLADTNHTKELIEQEKVKNTKLLGQSKHLLGESAVLNDLLAQGQNKNLELDRKLSELTEIFERLKFEVKSIPVKSIKEEPKIELEEDQEHHHNEPLLEVESQRGKVETPIAQLTDELLDKILDETTDKEKRIKTKYHLAVWRTAFTIMLNTVFYLFSAIALIIILSSGIQSESNEEAPNVMGFSVLRVVTGSMEPTLEINTVILIREVEPNNLQIGDIATYLRDDGLLITHRVYSIETDDFGNNIAFRLKGDANSAAGGLIPSEDIVGHVIFYSYAIGNMLMFFEIHFMSTIGVTIILLIVFYFGKRRILKRIDEKSDTDESFEDELTEEYEPIEKQQLEEETIEEQSTDEEQTEYEPIMSYIEKHRRPKSFDEKSEVGTPFEYKLIEEELTEYEPTKRELKRENKRNIKEAKEREKREEQERKEEEKELKRELKREKKQMKREQ